MTVELPPDDRIEDLFCQAAELPPSERMAFLDNACRGNLALRAEIEGLLACDEQAPAGHNLLDSPPVQLPGSALAQTGGPAFGPPAAPGEVGTLGPYRVLQLLGEGGMGMVYSAIDTRLDRRLALKVMILQYASDPEARERFLREARAAAQICHDNVVTVYEAGVSDGVPYIAMQMLEGYSLDKYLRDGGVPPLSQVLQIAQQAAEGLAAAHRVGLMHRDVKPANLWLEAPHGRVKVLDFGLARPLDNRIGMTMTGAVMGSPAYMSPEQARGERLDHRTDLFSLGAVLYRLCGGRLPFEGPTTMAALTALATQDPQPLQELNPAIPGKLAALIHQMLAKRADERPPSADDVVQQLHAIAQGTTGEEKISPTTAIHLFNQTTSSIEVKPPARSSAELGMTGARRRWLAGGLTVLVGFAVAGAMIMTRPSDGVKKNIAGQDNGDSWIKTVGVMSAPDQIAAVQLRLKELNSSFDEKSMSHKIQNGVVVEVAVGNASGLKDLTPLRALSGLKNLYLQDGPRGGTDISPLRGLKLAKFDSNGCPPKDLSALSGMPLTTANFWGLATTDLSPLRGMKLVETNVGNSSVKDISVLKGMPLERVCLNVSNVDDLSALAGAPLTRLFAANIKAKDLKPVANAPIEWLTIDGTPIEDLTPLLTMPLKALEMDNPERHIALLRRIPTLQMINHKPAAEFLGAAGSADTDPDRDAAMWVVSLGGVMRIRVDGGESGELRDAGNFPKGHFSVTDINLDGNKAVTDAGLAHLRDLPQLTVLNLQNTPITDAGLPHLAGCKKLTKLWLAETAVTGAGLAQLQNLELLEDLYLGSTAVYDADLAQLAKLKSLSRLFIQNTKVTDDGLSQLKNIKGLQQIDLFSTKITDAGVAHLKDCRRLSKVCLGATGVSDASLAVLKDLPDLTEINVMYTSVGDEGMQHIKDCRGLSVLYLSNSRVSDVGLSHLRALTQLTALSLNGTPITDEGVAHLQTLTALTSLSVNGAPVTDKGLAYLSKLKGLTQLEIRKTLVTAQGLKKFHTAVPRCLIEHDDMTIAH
jgi:serine/threonine protein kinase/Leucine-rich repeat (LRR) protein